MFLLIGAIATVDTAVRCSVVTNTVCNDEIIGRGLATSSEEKQGDERIDQVGLRFYIRGTGGCPPKPALPIYGFVVTE